MIISKKNKQTIENQSTYRLTKQVEKLFKEGLRDPEDILVIPTHPGGPVRVRVPLRQVPQQPQQLVRVRDGAVQIDVAHFRPPPRIVFHVVPARRPREPQ